MNGILDAGLSFWQIIITVLTLIFGFVAIRVSLNFDLNKYLERRDKQRTQRLKNACTHIEMIPLANNQFQFKSLFESPPGTFQWQCQRCGLIRNHNNDYEERAQYYADNPDKYIAQTKKFQKILKKSRMV